MFLTVDLKTAWKTWMWHVFFALIIQQFHYWWFGDQWEAWRMEGGFYFLREIDQLIRKYMRLGRVLFWTQVDWVDVIGDFVWPAAVCALFVWQGWLL